MAQKDIAQKLLEDYEDVFADIVNVLVFDGEEHWSKPRTLKELLNISEELDDYISDYRINVIEIAWLDDETISKFTSDFRIVADFFVQKRKNKHYQPSAEKIRHVDELLKLLVAFTGDPTYGEMIPSISKGGATMCSVVEQFMNEGRTSEQKRIAENMVNQGFNDEQILAVTGITRECLDAIKHASQKLS